MKPDRPESLSGKMLVRIARISRAQSELPLLESWLDDKERERAARFHFAEDRARFILGRSLLRQCLSPYLQHAPEYIRFALTDRDRPVLPDNETLNFSLSHSHDLVAVALTQNARIGIDVEWMQNKSDLAELARRILSETDLHTFQGLPEAKKVAAFFHTWTRKEAYLKATGEGITDALQKISVSFGPEKNSCVTDTRTEADSTKWCLITLPVPVDYMGSVACDDTAKSLEYAFVHFDRGELVND